MKLSKQIISLLLVIVMVIGLLPYSAFADTGNNGETGYEDQGNGGSGTATWSIPGRDYWGVRFSLYFSEDKTGKDGFEPVGKTIDTCMTSFGYTPNRASMWNVYDRMHIKKDEKGLSTNKMNEFGFTVVDYSSICLTRSSSSALQKFPNLMQDGLSSKVLNKYFMGIEELPDDLTTLDTNKMDFTNTDAIVDLIIKDASDVEVNFKDGIYKTKDETRYGIFKLYYEPIFYFKVNSTTYAMTLRDAIAFYNCKPDLTSEQGYDFVVFYFRFLKYLANAAYLVQDEDSIDMKGNSSGTLMDSSDSSSDVKSSMKKGGLMYDSMGVGVVTGGIYGPPAPDVLKTYVVVDRVDADGTIHYKKAADSVIEKAEFRVDATGDLSQVPAFAFEEGLDVGTAVLNDIMTIGKDVTVSDATEWTDTEMPTGVGVDLLASSRDVAGYCTGIITGSEIFVDTYKEYSLLVEPSSAAMEAVKESYAAMSESSGSSAIETTQIIPVGLLGRSPFTVVIKIVDAIPYVYINDIKMGKIEDGQVVKITEDSTEMGSLGIRTPANNLLLRYVVIPNPMQINVIRLVEEGTGKVSYIDGGRSRLETVGTTVNVQEPVVDNLEKLGSPELIEWVTNSEYPLKDIANGTLPSPSSNGLTGSDRVIPNYPQTPLVHNLYVLWEIKVPAKDTENPSTEYEVPEWRLSKYWGPEGVPDGAATMTLPITYGCCGQARLSPSGFWKYTVRNPNGKTNDGSHSPSNMKLYSWIHTETVNTGDTASVGAYQPTAIVTVDGIINAIKSTDTSGLKVVSWLDKGSINGLKSYDISSDTKGSAFNKSQYSYNVLLNFNTLNLDTYTNTWPSRHSHKYGGHCHRWINSKTISPLGASYIPYGLTTKITFDRYLAKGSDKLVVSPYVSEENGKTIVSYQTDTTLKIYPEIAMLFDNDLNQSSIKWAVGEQAREINPVVWHTMQFKVYVDENSNAASFATDSRGITTANRMGEANKQIAYKGTSINTSFKIQRSEDDNKNAGILTVKTFALDITTNKNGVNVKDAWGASSYKPETLHTNFIDSWDGFKGLSTERLEVQSSKLYVGAEKNQSVGLTKLKYDGKEVVEFTHELIVRGGEVVGVKYQDRGTGAYSVVAISDLEKKDAGLYEALEGMKLIGKNKNETVFKGFEHQTGASLNEQKYIDLATSAKQALDGLTTNNLSLNKGWYSEDSTVLVVKEYVTNYGVPSISYSDKLSQSVAGLETPLDKGLFFSILGKGYTFINYTYTNNNLKNINGGLSTAKVFFEHNSRLGSPFGKQQTDYLVANVSVLDTSRLY